MDYQRPSKLVFWLILNTILLVTFSRKERTDGLSFWDMSDSPHLFENVNAKGLIMYMVIAAILEDNLLNNVGMAYARTFGKPMPVRARHLDELSFIDQLEVGFNQAITTPTYYLYSRFIYYNTTLVWGLERLNLVNTLGGITVFILISEFLYYWLHRIGHHPKLYAYMHKGHHAQLAPSRGWDDGVIGSPLEFLMVNFFQFSSIPIGVALMGSVGLEVHAAAAYVAKIIAGLIGVLNHTRYEVSFSILGFEWYNSTCHDLHHRMPGYNFCPSLVWDKVFGTYRPADPNEGFRADMQLDEKTGKSIAYSRIVNQN